MTSRTAVLLLLLAGAAGCRSEEISAQISHSRDGRVAAWVRAGADVVAVHLTPRADPGLVEPFVRIPEVGRLVAVVYASPPESPIQADPGGPPVFVARRGPSGTRELDLPPFRLELAGTPRGFAVRIEVFGASVEASPDGDADRASDADLTVRGSRYLVRRRSDRGFVEVEPGTRHLLVGDDFAASIGPLPAADEKPVEDAGA